MSNIAAIRDINIINNALKSLSVDGYQTKLSIISHLYKSQSSVCKRIISTQRITPTFDEFSLKEFA